MSESPAMIKATYPLPVYNYRVTILNAGQPETIGFSEVSGLSDAYEPVTYKDGLSFIMGYATIPGMAKPVNVILKRGLTRSGSYLQDWLNAASHGRIVPGVKRDVLIDLCDEAGKPVIRWTVFSALPIKLDAPAFAAASNEVAIAKLELVAPKLKVEFGL